MMKSRKLFHKFIALLLAVLLVLGTAPAVLAANDDGTTPGIIYKGQSVLNRWVFQNVTTTYTPTDLFRNFKGVMPGDVLTQDFIAKNESSNTIKLYMKVLPHDESNALSENVAAQTNLDDMIVFLNQFSLQVVTGEGESQIVLFDIPEGQLGTYSDNAELGSLPSGMATKLKVKLNVPITMDNTFASEIGEVDFVFTIEEITSGGGGNPPGKDPEKDPEEKPDPDEPIIIPGKPVEDVEDPDEVIDAPQTGDTADILTPLLLMLIAIAGLFAVHKGRKREK